MAPGRSAMAWSLYRRITGPIRPREPIRSLSSPRKPFTLLDLKGSSVDTFSPGCYSRISESGCQDLDLGSYPERTHWDMDDNGRLSDQRPQTSGRYQVLDSIGLRAMGA